MEPELYKGDAVICKKPCEWIDEGYSGAICVCGHDLFIKTPKIKKFHQIKCPNCGFIISLYCGKDGEKWHE